MLGFFRDVPEKQNQYGRYSYIGMCKSKLENQEKASGVIQSESGGLRIMWSLLQALLSSKSQETGALTSKAEKMDYLRETNPLFVLGP